MSNPGTRNTPGKALLVHKIVPQVGDDCTEWQKSKEYPVVDAPDAKTEDERESTQGRIIVSLFPPPRQRCFVDKVQAKEIIGHAGNQISWSPAPAPVSIVNQPSRRPVGPKITDDT